MISTGAELTEFITSLNGEAEIEATLLGTLVENAKTMIEDERPWMVLRKTDKTKTVTTANTWQTAIDLSTITDFNRFYGEMPIILFDGVNLRTYYRQVPFDRQVEYKNISGTFCYDENSKTLYLNGLTSFSGTLYINYVCSSPDIDLTSQTAIWTLFPKRFLPLLGYYAVGVYKGAIDFDIINKMMVGANAQAMTVIHTAMVDWDTEKQMSSIENNDPTEFGEFPRSSAIDIRNRLQ